MFWLFWIIVVLTNDENFLGESIILSNKSTVEQDRAILSKLLYDFDNLRERVASMYEVNLDTPEFAFAETQLLRLEVQVCSLQGMIWFKNNINRFGKSDQKTFQPESFGIKGSRYLAYVRGMLRYVLCTDRNQLAFDQQKRLSGKLNKVLRLISCKRYLLENQLQNITNSLASLSALDNPHLFAMAEQLRAVDRIRLVLSTLRDRF